MKKLSVFLIVFSFHLSSYSQDCGENFNEGIRVGQSGDMVGAISLFSKAIVGCHDLTQAYLYRGIAYAALGNPQAAIDDLNQALIRDPDNSLGHSTRGYLHMTMGNRTKAEWDLSTAIELDPTDAEAYFYRGMINLKLGKEEYTISDFCKAIEIGVRWPEPDHEGRLVYFRQDSTLISYALSEFEDPLEFEKSYIDLLTVRAAGLLAMRQLEDGCIELKKAKELADPNELIGKLVKRLEAYCK